MEICNFCNIGKDLKLKDLGNFRTFKNINFHTNCLVLSSGTYQTKNKRQVICGFEYGTIKRELKRGKNQKCIFCDCKGATIDCSFEKCLSTFHLPCALSSGKTLHLYFGRYESYCPDHCPLCVFDMENIVGIVSQSYSPSCCKQLFYHKNCLGKYVMDAGKTSKCPNCHNVEQFKEFITNRLCINIPNKKASYDNIPNTAYDLQCSAPVCLCRKGRFHHNQNSKTFELISCVYCGSEAVHRKCGNITKLQWVCQNCDLGEDNFIMMNPAEYKQLLSMKRKTNCSNTDIENPSFKKFKIVLFNNNKILNA